MRKLILLLLLAVSLPLAAAPLETPFFSWEVPDGWTVSRNPSGLWQLTAPGAEPLEVTLMAARLNTTPEAYLQGTTALWRSLGQVEPLQPLVEKWRNQAWFLVKHPPQAGQRDQVTVKWVAWRGPLLVVTSFKTGQADLPYWEPRIRELGQQLRVVRQPKFEEALLRAEANTALRDNEDSAQHLRELEQIKLAMAVARQDWEPFFGSEQQTQPDLYRAYIDYLEARYEASFAIVNGPDLGMGPDIVESRLRGLANRRNELRRQVQGF
jgi:hypothetical protein